MARPRTELQELLEDILGNRNVYFQPPESKKLTYPCIVYNWSGVHKNAADNTAYRLLKRYQITYIDKDPDSDTPYELMGLRLCSLDRTFVSDNLNHYVFTIYF